MPARASKKAEIGPLPVPVRTASTPSTTASTVSVSVPSLSVAVEPERSWMRPHGFSGLGRYSSANTSQIAFGVTSPPSASVLAWMIRENSICMRRGRSSLWSFFRTYAMPPLPDCELTRMTAS